MPTYPFGLRPKSIAAILDNTFRLYRRNFAAICLFGLLIGGLGQLITQLIQILLVGGTPVTEYQNLLSAYGNMLSGYGNPYFGNFGAVYQDFGAILGASTIMMLLNMIVNIFVTSFVIGGIVGIAAGYAHGNTAKPAVWFGSAGRRYGRLTLTGFARLLFNGISYAALSIGALIIFAVVFLAAFYSLAISVIGMLAVILAVVVLASWPELFFPVAIVENKYGFQGIGRAFSLFFKNFWRMSGLLILVWLITLIINLPLSLIPTILPLLGLTDPGLISAGVYWGSVILSVLVGALTTPVLPIATTLIYLDIRVRREGYDIALKQRDQALKAAGEWNRGDR